MTTARTVLWFDGHIEEAAAFHVALLPASEITAVMRRPERDDSRPVRQRPARPSSSI